MCTLNQNKQCPFTKRCMKEERYVEMEEDVYVAKCEKRLEAKKSSIPYGAYEIVDSLLKNGHYILFLDYKGETIRVKTELTELPTDGYVFYTKKGGVK